MKLCRIDTIFFRLFLCFSKKFSHKALRLISMVIGGFRGGENPTVTPNHVENEKKWGEEGKMKSKKETSPTPGKSRREKEDRSKHRGKLTENLCEFWKSFWSLPLGTGRRLQDSRLLPVAVPSEPLPIDSPLLREIPGPANDSSMHPSWNFFIQFYKNITRDTANSAKWISTIPAVLFGLEILLSSFG